MKIAVTCQGDKLDDQMDQRFGRSPFFLIVDSDTMEYEAIENTNATLGQGAGIQSAQMSHHRSVRFGTSGSRRFQKWETDIIPGTDRGG